MKVKKNRRVNAAVFDLLNANRCTMQSARFTQRPFRVDDAEFIIAAHRLPHACSFVSAPPSTQRVIETIGEPNLIRNVILDEDGERAGLWIASVYDGWLVEFHLVIAALPRRGVGRFAVRAVKQYAFEEIKAHRLWLEVAAANAGARALYESEGFVHEGTYRHGFRRQDGGFEDLAHYGMLESEYR